MRGGCESIWRDGENQWGWSDLSKEIAHSYVCVCMVLYTYKTCTIHLYIYVFIINEQNYVEILTN